MKRTDSNLEGKCNPVVMTVTSIEIYYSLAIDSIFSKGIFKQKTISYSAFSFNLTTDFAFLIYIR